MPRAILGFLKGRAKDTPTPPPPGSQVLAPNPNRNAESMAMTVRSLPIHDQPSSTLALGSYHDPTETTDDCFGIRTISNPTNADIDIWFVHGLTGNRDSTWTHPNGTFTPDLLRMQYPTARIITYGYDANIVGLWKNTSGDGLRGHGKTLAYAISNSRPKEDNRPLYFVAHSLGGLVTEQALLVSLEPGEPRLRRIAACTVGVVFMGTPHSGSYLATWGYTLARLLGGVWRTNKEVLSVLKQKSEVLRAVEEVFQRQLSREGMLHHVRIFCFYETVAVDIVGFVVPEESATMLPYPNCGIDANHMDMTKFSSRHDAGFISLKGVIDDWIKRREKEAVEKIPSDSRYTSSAATLTFNNSGSIKADVFQQGTGNAGRDYYNGNVSYHGAGRGQVNETI